MSARRTGRSASSVNASPTAMESIAVFFIVCVLPAAAIMGLCFGIDSCIPDLGHEQGHCYGNRTCHEGLVCASDICVRLPDGGAK